MSAAQSALDRMLRAAAKVHVMLGPSQTTRLAMAEFVIAASDLADAALELDRRVRRGEPLPPAWSSARQEAFAKREAEAARPRG